MPPGVVTSPGVIAVPTGSLTRYPSFWTSLLNLQRPRGSVLTVVEGHSIAQNMNNAIHGMLAQPEFQWIWLIGDDHVFAPTTLRRLLDRRVDMVAPLTPSRSNGGPVIQKPGPDGLDAQLTWPEVPPGGLHEVPACSGAGLLIQRYVLEKVPAPWFELGTIVPDVFSEDIAFYRKARAAGFHLFVDLDVLIGHTTPVTLWPALTPEGWSVILDIQNLPAPSAPGPDDPPTGAQSEDSHGQVIAG